METRDITQTKYGDGGAHEINHDAEHVNSHLFRYVTCSGAVKEE